MTPQDLKEAVERAGGQSAVARKIGCTSQAVSKWCNTGEVPVKRVLAFEKATGVRRQDLYPELFETSAPSPTPPVMSCSSRRDQVEHG